MEKEVYEETGYVTKAIKLIALLDKYKGNYPFALPHTYKCFFLCSIQSQEPCESIEALEIGFFALDNLPELSLHRVNKENIALMFEYYAAQNLPTVFD